MKSASLLQIKEHHRQFRKNIEDIGNLLRSRKMPQLTEEMFSIYEKTGNRLLYENDYFERRKFLAVFGLLSAWYHREEDIRKLEEVMEEICQEETWALPAHVNRKEKDWMRTVDLFASETGQALAQILYLNKGFISENLAQRVKELVIYRVLDSYMEVPRGQWRWEGVYNNWVAVCAGCLGSMALYLLEDDKEKQQAIINRVCDTLPDYLKGMYDDGTCPEGLCYFTYGMAYYAGFAKQLYDYTDGVIDLMDSEKVRNIARFQQKCYLPGGKTVSFGDGRQNDPYRLGLTCYLAMRVDGVEIPDISYAMKFEDDLCYRFMANWQDDCWVQEYLDYAGEGQEEATEWFTILPDARWAIWKKKYIGIAFKGGHNGVPHNHNDIGSFLLTADGEVFLADLGCGEYTKEYFEDSTRYGILCNRSLGHSVPVIGGKEQKPGKEFADTGFISERPGCVQLSYSGAYEKNASWELTRKLESYEGEERLMITDTISGSPHSFMENLVTQIVPIVEGKQIILNGNRGTVRIILSEECGPVTIIRKNFRNHHGRDEAVWLMQFTVEINEEAGGCRLQCKYERGNL